MLLVPCLLHSHSMQTQHVRNVVCSYYLYLDEDKGAVFRADVSQGSVWQILHAPKHFASSNIFGSVIAFERLLQKLWKHVYILIDF